MPATECGFTIRQRICVEVPVQFGAETTTDEARVLCGEVSTNNICTNCTPIGI